MPRFTVQTPKGQAAEQLFASGGPYACGLGWGDHVTKQLQQALAHATAKDLVRCPDDVREDDPASFLPIAATAASADFVLEPPVHLHGRPEAIPAVTGPRGLHEPFRLYEVREGLCAAIAGMPLLYDATGGLLANVSSAYWPLLYFYDHRKDAVFRQAARLTGDTLILADDIWEVNFCHWLVDTLPRLALLGPLRSRSQFHVVVGPYTSAFQRESLVALGVDPRNIHSAADAVSFSCERMWVPSNLGRIYHPAFKMSGWATDFLRSSFVRPQMAAAGDRVYLSRGDAARRRIRNESQLVVALEARGFRTVQLGALPFLEQAQALREAQVTIGLHGAGLSHVLFQQAGGALVEIFPSSYGTMSFYVMAVATGHRYFTYTEEAIVAGAWTQCDDIIVDVNAFMRALDQHVLAAHSS